jgi:hypothetical protein
LTPPGPVRIDLVPSPGLAAAILGLHGLAAVSLWVTIPGWSGAAIAILVVLLGVAAAWNRALLRGRRAVRALEIAGPEEVVLEFSDGTRRPARTHRRRHVSRFGVALRLYGLRRRSLFVAAGMLDPAAARRLRIWALWGRVAAPAGENLSRPTKDLRELNA